MNGATQKIEQLENDRLSITDLIQVLDISELLDDTIGEVCSKLAMPSPN